MRKVLPRTVITVLLLLLFLPQLSYSAENLSKTPSSQAHPLVLSSLTLTAPADVTVATDPYSNVAESVYLGTPNVTGYGVNVWNNAPYYFPIGTTVVTWTATDNSGDRVEAMQRVTVVDNQKPFLSRRPDISVPNDPGSCGAKLQLATPFAFDNSGQVTVTHDGPDEIFPVGTTSVTWTATDASGNTETMVQQVIVTDNELPTIQLANAAFAATAVVGQCGAVVDIGTPVVSDNCGIASISSDAPAVFPVGVTTVTWTVTDLNHYTVTAQQTVTVTDNESPTIAAPAAVTRNNDPGMNGAAITLTSATAGDNCGIASITNDAPAFFNTGNTTVTWTATDVHGNTATAVQVVTVKDVEAPVLLNVPADMTVSCEKVPALAMVAVKDNCDGSPTVTMNETSTQGSNTSLASRYNYSITRTWTATDKSGNKSTARQQITVVDKTAPVISAPDIITGNDPDKCSAVVKYNASITDNSGSPLTVTYSKPSGSIFSSGTTTITVTAKDISGNSSSRSFAVTVNDTQSPEIKAPANVTVNIANNASSATNVNLGKPATSDNCGVKTISNDAPASFPVGTTIVTWTVRDLGGNIETAAQTVTVNRRKSNASDNFSATTTSEATALELVVAPNPAPDHFTIRWNARVSGAVYLRVTDVSGRVMDMRSGLASSGSVAIGQAYPAGYYIAELVQGAHRKTMQLIKLK